MKRDLPQPCSDVEGNPGDLLKLASMRMPFGKYQGRLLIDLPEPYVVWFAGEEYLFEPLLVREQGRTA